MSPSLSLKDAVSIRFSQQIMLMSYVVEIEECSLLLSQQLNLIQANCPAHVLHMCCAYLLEVFNVSGNNVSRGKTALIGSALSV